MRSIFPQPVERLALLQRRILTGLAKASGLRAQILQNHSAVEVGCRPSQPQYAPMFPVPCPLFPVTCLLPVTFFPCRPFILLSATCGEPVEGPEERSGRAPSD